MYIYVYVCIYIYISGLTTRPSVSPWLGVCVHACVARASKWLCFEQHLLYIHILCV